MPPMEAAGTRMFGRFELLGTLGRGSQGVVYLARDPSLDREVAIKLIVQNEDKLGPARDDCELKEGRLGSKLNHPNIVSVYEAGQNDGFTYIVFEYVRGTTLRELMTERGKISVADVCRIIGPLLDAIAHAHGNGVVHLDLSPRNILVDENGTPRIMDFGLAERACTNRTDTSSATGTPRYMTPEHFNGGEFGPYSDVFALCMVFVEMVTGVPAAAGHTPEEIIWSIVNDPVNLDALLQYEHGVAFLRFIQGGSSRETGRRYPHGAAMKAAFEDFCQAAGVCTHAPVDTTTDYLMRRMRRKGDFPSLSRSMIELNRMSDEDSTTCADKAANIILRDYALTKKLLKLVNSSFYRSVAGEISNVSQAIVLLGLTQVRMTANSMTFFSALSSKSGSMQLRDLMTRSFVAGLLTRHLARKILPVSPEDAFIGGMFHNLGECLVAYYFPEEYREIIELATDDSISAHAASREVLGVGYAALGSRVAASWHLPENVIAIAGTSPPDRVEKPANAEDSLRDIALLCNDLCAIAGRGDSASRQKRLAQLVDLYQPSIALTESRALTLLAAGLSKLQQFAPIMDLDFRNGSFFAAAEKWVGVQAAIRAC